MMKSLVQVFLVCIHLAVQSIPRYRHGFENLSMALAEKPVTPILEMGRRQCLLTTVTSHALKISHL